MHPVRHLQRLGAVALFALAVASTPAQAQAPVAAEIHIGGIGPAVDATAFRKVKLLLADALARDTIAYFDVYGYGKEGGFSACVEKGLFAADGSFERLLATLRAVRVNTSTTAYNITPVDQCSYPVAAP